MRCNMDEINLVLSPEPNYIRRVKSLNAYDEYGEFRQSFFQDDLQTAIEVCMKNKWLLQSLQTIVDYREKQKAI